MIFLIFKALFYVRFYIYIILRRLNFFCIDMNSGYSWIIQLMQDSARQKDEDDVRRNEGD